MATQPLSGKQRDKVALTSRAGTKHQELTLALRGLVAQMRPGDRLPTQEELMRRFAVSDTTVLRSLSDLRRDGLIVRRQGSGTFVAEIEATGSGAAAGASVTPSVLRREGDMVAVLSRPSNRAFFSDMIQAVEANLGRAGMAPVLLIDTDVTRNLRRAHEYAARNGVVGAIHIGSAFIETEPDQLPLIMIGETDQNPDFCQVSLDNFGAGRRVGEHLWDLGHRGVAVITLRNSGSALPQGIDRYRVAGIRALWEERGGAWNEAWQIGHRFLLQPGDPRAVSVMRSYLEPLFNAQGSDAAAAPPTAIFAAHDEMATVAIRALEAMGLRVPDDISVIGFNDSGNLAAYFRPALTTVRTPSPTLGTLAVHLLLDLLQHPDRKPRSVRLPAEIITRESTAPPGHAPQNTASPPARGTSSLAA